MSNYDFALDMSTDNSNSIILRAIKPKSKVLEFGSAHGRMTKYLKETLECQVTIIELDQDAGKVAAQYASNAFVGKSGDIENTYWYYETEEDKFDFVIFADVLEHLHDPALALRRASERLSPDGSILISIPNISHNSVLIDLLQDKFEYRDVGILDKTHLKFFTHSSLKQMIEDNGFTVVKEFNAINVVNNTEFKNSYNQLPSEVGEFLKSRKFGEVYQFIWELKRSKVVVSCITPIYNKWNFTKSYLEDMLKLDNSKIEIILVDNASTDETNLAIQPYLTKYRNVKYIRNEINNGFGKASDQGKNIAAGEYLLFMNNDIKVRSDFDTWVNRLIEACTDDNIVGPTGGKVDLENEFQFMYETNDPKKPINYLSGWCMMMKRRVMEKLCADGNLFDPAFFCYYEDTNLSFKAKFEHGIDFKIVEIPVVHFGKISSKQLNTYALYKESKKIFLNKWKHLL